MKNDARTKYVEGVKSKSHHLYKTWDAMKGRCYRKSDPSYPRYGGRGITVCRRWRNSFSSFVQDMGAKPDGFQLERMDNDKGYFPENCCWASRSEQARNRRSNNLLTFKGETRPIIEWAEITGLNPSTISIRTNRLGWSVEKTLTTPSRSGGIMLTYKGETRPISEWAILQGISAETIYQRIKNPGWSVSDALTKPSKRKSV